MLKRYAAQAKKFRLNEEIIGFKREILRSDSRRCEMTVR